MEPEPQNSDLPSTPPASGRFSWPRLGVWLPAAVLLGVVAAWVSVLAQSYFNPWLVVSMLLGFGLGGMLVGMVRFAQIGNRPTIVAGAVLAVAVAVVGQHYIAYQHDPGKAELAEQGTRCPVLKFAQHMQRQATQGREIWGWPIRGGEVWANWGLEALIVLGATLALVIPVTRQPFCDRCRTWYYTLRSGRIGLTIARRVAEFTATPLGSPVRSVRYRLSCCRDDCGPTRLELSWEELDGRTFLNVAWIDAEQRNVVLEAIDGGLSSNL